MSALPSNTEKFLYAGGTWRLPGDEGVDTDCEGAKFHSPRPLFTQHTPLVLREWWPEAHAEDSDGIGHWVWAPKASLCGTCRDNLNILLQMLYATNGDLDWSIRREYGNVLRGLAMRGWEWFVDHRPASDAEPAT